jgi:hypothetical protein
MAVVAALLSVPSQISAGWKDVRSGEVSTVAKSKLAVTATKGWNVSSSRPVKKGEMWSHDGPLLNRLEFFGGIAKGEPLAREQDKKNNPLPKFDSAMLIPDIAQLYEQTQRIVIGTPVFQTEAIEPATFAGRKGFRFAFRYTGEDELTRRGEAMGAVIDGKLYLICYTAAALHYFDKDLAAARAVMASARL